jgi:hypothetical protein
MSQSKKRFALPAFLMIMGIYLSLYTIQEFTSTLPTNFDFIPMAAEEGTAFTDVTFVLFLAMPILAFEYYVLAVPIATLYLFLNKAIKAKSYDTNIMNIGRDFGGFRMVKRAGVPAVFSLTFANVTSGVIQTYVFADVPKQPGFPGVMFEVSVTLMAALIIMAGAMLIFVPTWILNDAGIVSHLRTDELKARQCPDTKGVGRWFSDKLGGFAVVTYPLTMWTSTIWPLLNEMIINGVIIWYDIFYTLGFLIILPLFVMAFIMPVVLLHERKQSEMSKRIHEIAKNYGAVELKKVRMQKVKRGQVKDETQEVQDLDIMTSLKRSRKKTKKKK